MQKKPNLAVNFCTQEIGRKFYSALKIMIIQFIEVKFRVIEKENI